MLPALAVLIDIQALDAAMDAARRRLAEIPAAEKAGTQGIAAATAALAAARARFNDATTARKAVEKDVAAQDSRLARFDEHKAAVKTNDEFHALQREIATAESEKGVLEERVIEMLLEADDLTAQVKDAEARLADAEKALAAMRAAHASEKTSLDADIARLTAEKQSKAAGVDKPTLARYETLLKGRKGVAVARMDAAEICTACHVKLRPAVAIQVRRNDSIVTCDSCQRILYYVPPAAAPRDAGAAS